MVEYFSIFPQCVQKKNLEGNIKVIFRKRYGEKKKKKKGTTVKNICNERWIKIAGIRTCVARRVCIGRRVIHADLNTKRQDAAIRRSANFQVVVCKYRKRFVKREINLDNQVFLRQFYGRKLGVVFIPRFVRNRVKIKLIYRLIYNQWFVTSFL